MDSRKIGQISNNILLVILASFLIGIVVGLWLDYAFIDRPCPAQAAPAGVVLQPIMVEPIELVPTIQAAMVAVAAPESETQTYTYRLDEYGHAIWREAGTVPAGALMKLGPCWEDGYRQVEYQDPARPSSWKVEYMKCIN